MVLVDSEGLDRGRHYLGHFVMDFPRTIYPPRWAGQVGSIELSGSTLGDALSAMGGLAGGILIMVESGGRGKAFAHKGNLTWINF